MPQIENIPHPWPAEHIDYMMFGIGDAALHLVLKDYNENLSLTTTSLIKLVNCDLFSNVF